MPVRLHRTPEPTAMFQYKPKSRYKNNVGNYSLFAFVDYSSDSFEKDEQSPAAHSIILRAVRT